MILIKISKIWKLEAVLIVERKYFNAFCLEGEWVILKRVEISVKGFLSGMLFRLDQQRKFFDNSGIIFRQSCSTCRDRHFFSNHKNEFSAGRKEQPFYARLVWILLMTGNLFTNSLWMRVGWFDSRLVI